MNVLVIDGQGGGIGKLLVSGIKSEYPDFFVTAVGANSIATSAMLKAGAMPPRRAKTPCASGAARRMS